MLESRSDDSVVDPHPGIPRDVLALQASSGGHGFIQDGQLVFIVTLHGQRYERYRYRIEPISPNRIILDGADSN